MGLVILSYQNFFTSTGTLQQLRELSACVFYLEFGKRQFGILSSILSQFIYLDYGKLFSASVNYFVVQV